MGHRIAVVGAAGAVGRELLRTLAERAYPADEVVALAPGRAAGQDVSFGEDRTLRVRALEGFDFRLCDLAFFCAGATVARQHAPQAAAVGALVIDASPAFRRDADVPLVVPEVNAAEVARADRGGIVAIPDAPAIQLLLALAPLHRAARLRRVVVSGFLSVSPLGKAAMDELWAQTRGIYVNEAPPAEEFPKQIAFNCIPQTSPFLEDGRTQEEAGLAFELRKVLGAEVPVGVTLVRVPVFIGHGLAVHAAFEAPLPPEDATRLLREAPGVVVLDRREEAGYATPAEVAGEDAVYVSRLRADASAENGLALWCVSDNLRKGAALTMVQVAEAWDAAEV